MFLIWGCLRAETIKLIVAGSRETCAAYTHERKCGSGRSSSRLISEARSPLFQPFVSVSTLPGKHAIRARS
jgi:hypothetical protein